jgi:hypothetical protein
MKLYPLKHGSETLGWPCPVSANPLYGGPGFPQQGQRIRGKAVAYSAHSFKYLSLNKMRAFQVETEGY